MLKRKTLIAAAAVLALAGAGAGTAYATTASSHAATAPPGSLYGCVSGSTRVLEHAYTVAGNFQGCPSGSFAVTIASGGAGPAGPKGATGATGPAGPAGPAGAGGASSLVQVAASTTVTSWPEGGGWGTDAFTRLVSETVQQVNSSHCSGAATCYEVFGTLTDSAGSTVPADGHASPNGSSTDKITAANISHIALSGQADFEFYADSGKVSASNVPAAMSGKQDGASTTTWGELAFPAGTQFFGAGLTAYDWTYTANVAYASNGTNVSCTQTWNDQITPGDDGQGAADGNITGTCPVSS